jgi:hypothetical protein
MSDQRQNILLCYDQIPEKQDYYFIPANAPLPLTLVHALGRLDNILVNHRDRSPKTDREWRDVAYLQAATYTDQQYLDTADEYSQNRFFAVLESYHLNPDSPAILDVDGPVVLIRTGIIL